MGWAQSVGERVETPTEESYSNKERNAEHRLRNFIGCTRVCAFGGLLRGATGSSSSKAAYTELLADHDDE